MQTSVPVWDRTGRVIVFLLASMSIWCLLAEFYGLCSMQSFAVFVLFPATALLILFAALDEWRGSGVLFRAVLLGSAAGLVAAAVYDVFRLPFVFAKPLGISGVIPALKLFKVFPRFGAMLLGEPIEQASYSVAAHALGWIYHFSNGLTFGAMYVALIGDVRRHWAWAMLFAVGLEVAILFTPYPRIFSIHVTFTFVVVTLLAHLIFGATLGLLVRWAGLRFPVGPVATPAPVMR
jgi:hypothetical protein